MPDYRLAAERAARKYGISPRIFLAMIQQESGFNPNADSGQARGIAQFTPGTAKAYGVNTDDGLVTDDLEGGARYLRDNLKRTGGNYSQALSIYNSGRPNTYKDPNFAKGQTYNYVKKILASAGGQELSGRPASPTQRSSPTSRTVTTSRQVTDPSTTSFVPNTESAGAGLSDLIGASLSSQKQQQAPAMMLEAPSHSASRYVNAVLPQAMGAMAKPKLDVGAVIGALEAAPGVSGLERTPGETRTVTSSQGVDVAGVPVPVNAKAKGASAAVDFAKSRVGAYAETNGNNRGPQLDALQARFGFKGAAWCAMFTSVAVTRGGAPKSARTASVAQVREQVQSGQGGYQKGFKAPKAGDLMLFGNAHIGLVESVNRDGTVNLIDGNNSTGKVARRKVEAGRGEFARPKYR